MRSSEPIIVPRQPLAIGAAIIALLFLGGGIFSLVKGYGSEKAPPSEVIQTIDAVTGESAAAIKPPVRYQSEFTMGGVAGFLCAIASGACAAWIFLRPINPDPKHQQADDRLALLVFGGILGAVVMLFGAALMYVWFKDLTAWLNKEDKVKVWKPLTALLVFLVGAGAMFLAAQPARGDERNSTPVRRAVYSVNLALSAVLVFALLLVLNIVVGLKLPARFDTTETGMYTISDNTREYLQQLKEDLTIYNTVPETFRVRDEGANLGADINRLLGSIREANPQRIHVKTLSQDLDKVQIADLKAKYKSTEMIDPVDGSTRLGLLFATGPDETKASFVGINDLFGPAPAPRGAQPKLQFQGESRIIREILFLTESKSKAVIYFTQGSGEISIERDPTPGSIGSVRMGEQLKSTLSADGTEVKPLKFDPANPVFKVPDDATAVIVADPRTTLPESISASLKNYMRTKRPDGSLGKIIVLAGAKLQPGGAGLLKIGVEEILEDFGIFMPPQAVYAQATNQYPPELILTGVKEALARQGNTIALAFSEVGFPAVNARRLEVRPNAEKPVRAEVLLDSFEDRYTWFEDTVVANPMQAFLAVRNAGEKRDLAYLQPRLPSQKPRAMALLASEAGENNKPVNRVAVYGFGSFFEDKGERRATQAELLSATVNWLRDRPAIANETNKTYGVYEPNRKMKWNEVFWLPVTVTLIGLGGMGLGLWAWRRK
jgi:hypothetical protein